MRTQSEVGIGAPALFASAFYPHVGGVEELSRQLAIGQRATGMSPVVVTMRWPKDLPAVDRVDGIEVLRHVFRVPEPSPRFLAGWALRSRATKRDIADQLKQRAVDLIHVQCVSGNARYAEAAARRLGVPLVVTMQGELTMDATGLYQRSAQQRRAWRALLDSADFVTGCSAQVIDEAGSVHPGAWRDRARVVPNGVRLDDFTAAEPWSHPKPFVLGIGRMVPQKGFDLLIRAFAALRPAGVDLLLAGDGPSRPELEALAGSLGLSDCVHFLGSVERPAAARLFVGAEVFVLPSRHEPQGIVVLEAMAARTPVVAAAVGGVPETVVDRENGLLFAGGDVDALAGSLDAVLADDGLAESLVAAGRLTAQQRDWTAITAEYLDVYQAAGARRSAAVG